MSNGPTPKLNACGCCVSTPLPSAPFNRPGLAALAYRIGTYPTFLRDMIAQLHAIAIPDGANQGSRPLAALTTRAADDPVIALLDAWAVVADVLTFYQERIANEGYLRTATERLSVLELARTIGYELSPGVAASAFLAFTADDSPGAPATVAVSRGVKVQNVPAQGKLPQTFETIEDLQAFASRNALRPRLTRPQDLALVFDPQHLFDKDDPEPSGLRLYLLGTSAGFPAGSGVLISAAQAQVYPLSSETIPDPVPAIRIDGSIYFTGIATNLQKGDRLLLVGRNDNNSPTVQTKLMIVRGVEAQANLNRTRVDLREDLGQSPEPPPFTPVKFPTPVLFPEPAAFNLANTSAILAGSISESDLNAFVTMNDWDRDKLVALAPFATATPPPTPPPPNPSAVLPAPDPGIFAMRTHAGIFGNNAPFYSSLLAPAGEGFPKPAGAPGGNFLYPNDWDSSGWPVWNDSITNQFYQNADLYLEQVVPGILRDSWIVLEFPSGDPAVFRVGTVSEAALAGFGLSGRVTGVRLTRIDGSSEITGADKASTFLVRTTIAYAQSEALDLIDLPITDDIAAGTTELMLNGLVLGMSVGQAVALTGARTAGDAPGVTASEVLTLEQITHVGGFTTLRFDGGLANSYVRSSPAGAPKEVGLIINANVARATHGETFTEVLGSGDASQSNQVFTLKRPPLTYVAAATPSGAASTLEVRVNDLEWQEVPALFGAAPTDQDYIVRLEDDGTTTVTFGDGVTGARLPSGNQNVAATYRTGIGVDGNVDAGALTILQTRPPGIRSVTNPLAASGGAGPEVLDRARQNAPLKVLTLDRIVALDDYENFARAFAGIGKAQAAALLSGGRYLVHLTIAGVNGAAVDPESALYASLIGAIGLAKDPVQQVLAANYQARFFDISASVLVDQPRFVAADVLQAAQTALQNAFSFDARAFAQPVTAAEVINVIQSVAGVIATDLTALFPIIGGVGRFEGGLLPILGGVRRFGGVPPMLCASPARLAGGAILPAELLLVNPAGIALSEMQP
ncbi:MAG: putative baseplate assembly protein [Deltaproteobacteria bacterium]|nr:putative baseplate assembly protein [Deltaproteobacteria bacterium]